VRGRAWWLAGLLLWTACAGAPPQLPSPDLTALPDTIRAEVEEALAVARQAPEDPEALGALGSLYYNYDFAHAAAVCFGMAAARAPETLEWRYLEALALEKSGQVESYGRALRQVLALDADYVPALVRRGALELETEPETARKTFERVLDLDPASARAQFGLGQADRIAGDRRAALEHFREAVALVPDYSEAHYAMAMILSAEGKREEAAVHLKWHAAGGEPPMTADPLRLELLRKGRSAVLLRRDADYLARHGDVQKAFELLEQAMKTDVSGSTTRHHMGLLLAQQGRFEEAVEQLRMVVQADPGNVDAISTLGLALKELGRDEEAENLYRGALGIHPGHGPSLVYLGQLLVDTGRAREGLRFLKRGVAAQPSNPLYQFKLGSLQAQLGEEEDALIHLEKAVKISPDYAPALYTLGVMLARRGDVAAARHRWLDAIQKDPRMPGPYGGLAVAALEAGRTPEAVSWAEKACERSGYQVQVYLDLLAEAYAAAGRRDDAARVRSMRGQRP